MGLSIREAKVRFAELVAAQIACGMDFEKVAEIRRAPGLDGLEASFAAAQPIPVALSAMTAVFLIMCPRSLLIGNVIPAQNDQVHDMQQHGLVVLVQGGRSELDQALLRTRL
jgi:hypothetical protein